MIAQKGVPVFYSPNNDSVPMGSRAWAEQNGGKSESHRLEGLRPGREPRGP